MPRDSFSPRVAARTALARALSDKAPALLAEHRLRPADLEEIVRRGDEAAAADAEQHVQIAQAAVERGDRKVSARDLLERDRDLADTLRAVIHDLSATSPADASFLAKLSFARYRVRVRSVDVKDATGAEVDTLKAVERVERADIPTRARGLAALCRALRQREPIVLALGERGMAPAELDDLALEADAVSGHGVNAMRPAEATARETAAVRAQSAKWSAIKPLVRRACGGDPELAALFARC